MFLPVTSTVYPLISLTAFRIYGAEKSSVWRLNCRFKYLVQAFQFEGLDLRAC